MQYKMLSASAVGEKFLPMAIATYSCCMLSPYFVWGRHYLYVLSFLVVLTFFFMWSSNKKVLNESSLITAGFISFCIMLFFLCSNSSLGWALMQGMGSGMLILAYRQFGNRLLDAFKWLFVITLVPAMLLWVWYAVGLPVDIWQVGIINDSVVPNQAKVMQGIHYYKYFGSIELDYMINSGLPLFRMCGIYDEPGVIGTVAGLLLAADRVDLTKKENMLLFVAGVMSLSLAFFVLVVLSLFFYFRWKMVLLFLLILFPSFLLLPNSFQENLQQKTIARLKVTDSGKLAGDNRESYLLKRNFNDWLRSDIFQLVFGERAANDGSASYKQIFLKTGVFGGLLVACVMILSLLGRAKTYSSIVFFFLFLASIYQRPIPLHFPIFMIFWCGIMGLSRIPQSLEIICDD